MGRFQKIPQKMILNAIEGSWGITSTVMKRLGCTWGTADKLIHSTDKTREAFQHEKEKILDLAQGKAYQAVANGDLSMIKWLLDRLGKDRGFGADPIAMMTEDPLKIEFEGQTTRETMETSPDIEISNDKESGADTE